MIDEFNNDVPYDFKNIQFYRKWNLGKSLWSTISNSNSGVPCYTFSSKGDKSTTSFTDVSLNSSSGVFSNIIKYYINKSKQTLNNICFFGESCYSNTFGNNCYNNTFNLNCYNNIFGNNCYQNAAHFFMSNSFGNNCIYNSFGGSCFLNTFGNSCSSNIFGVNCSYNSFGNSCSHNSFGNNYCDNSFGNGCQHNSFRISASISSTLKNYVQYNHFDDGCSYNVIWNSNTTSSTILLKNINVNRGVVGTDSSYNMININILNSEQEINVNQVDGIVSIGNILSITYESLKTLRDNSQLIPGQKYRIIDYITTTSQENTKSAGHQFDIIVTALDESTLSEEARAIQHEGDTYFNDCDLNAWKLWYCLDNDVNRFVWAGNEKIGEIEHKSYDSSKCTINPELINGNAFITPFNFESCVWVDGDNDNNIPYDTPHHDISELVYE